MSCETVNDYDIGDLVILKNGTFRDSAGNATDPPIVYCKVANPYGLLATYQFGIDSELEMISTGAYRLTIKPDKPGYWEYRWQAVDDVNPITAALEGAEQRKFYVKSTVFV